MARNPKRSIAALATVALAIALLALVRADAGGDAKKTPKEKDKTDWKPLLDGKSLTGWKATNFGGEGDVSVKNGIVLLERGAPEGGDGRLLTSTGRRLLDRFL